MFYIHSSTGRVFSGTLEALRRIEKPNATRQNPDDYRFNDLLSETGKQNTERETYTPSSVAVNEYQKLLSDNNAPELVYHAYQIMSHPVSTLDADSNWLQAYEQFQRHPYKLLPVVNAQRKLVGVLSRHTLYQTMLIQPEQLRESSTVSQIPEAKQAVISAHPVTDVRRIASLLIERELAAMPVLEESDRIAGIVSRTDILKCVAQEPPLSLWC